MLAEYSKHAGPPLTARECNMAVRVRALALSYARAGRPRGSHIAGKSVGAL